jgi:hypothetical protein
MIGMIIGMGEVGKALYKVLSAAHEMHTYDTRDSMMVCPNNVDVLHICYGYGPEFDSQTLAYIQTVNPVYTVIHSTVPVGTSQRLGCFHSPVRGVHPHLAESMRMFDTYLAPPSETLAAYFNAAGMHIYEENSPDNTEAGKLWSLAAYATSILLEKAIYRYCENRGLDFATVYTDFTESYNTGFQNMGRDEFTRPILRHVPGPIGGHCVIQAVEKLADDGEILAEILLGLNAAELTTANVL